MVRRDDCNSFNIMERCCIFSDIISSTRVVVYPTNTHNMKKNVFPSSATEFIFQFKRGSRFVTNPNAEFWKQNHFHNIIYGKKPQPNDVSFLLWFAFKVVSFSFNNTVFFYFPADKRCDK